MWENSMKIEPKVTLNTGNQDIIDHVLYPYVFKLEKHIPVSITPNQLTFMGFICGLLSFFSLLFIANRVALLISAGFILLWWFFDALDGVHARHTNQCSKFGGFLDHFLDTLTAGLLFFSVVVRFKLFTPLFIFIILLRLITQAVAYLSQAHTNQLHLPTLGPSVETFFLVSVLIASFFYDKNFFLLGEPSQGKVSDFLQSLSVYQVNIVKCAMLPYLFILPLALQKMFYRTQRFLI